MKMRKTILILLMLPLLISTQVNAITYHNVSWYGKAFHGNYTKSGDIFNMHALTCASNTHKIGTRLKVTNPETKKSVIVIVNDTGSFSRVTLDLSSGAFKRIADLKLGIIKVIIKVLK